MGVLRHCAVCALDTAKNPGSSWEIYGHFTKILGNSRTLLTDAEFSKEFVGVLGILHWILQKFRGIRRKFMDISQNS